MSEPAIRDDFTEEPEKQRPRFVIDTDSKADWCLRKIKEKQAERERWIEHYKSLEQKTTAAIDDDIAYFTGLLEEFMHKQIDGGFAKETKTQASYPLPTGKLVLKHQEPEYKPDDETLVPWLEKNKPDYVKVQKSADWAGLKKTLILNGTTLITEDGEIVPGITVTPRPDKFKAEVAKDGKH